MNDYARHVLEGENKALVDHRKHWEGVLQHAREQMDKAAEKLASIDSRIRSLGYVLETGDLDAGPDDK